MWALTGEQRPIQVLIHVQDSGVCCGTNGQSGLQLPKTDQGCSTCRMHDVVVREQVSGKSPRRDKCAGPIASTSKPVSGIQRKLVGRDTNTNRVSLVMVWASRADVARCSRSCPPDLECDPRGVDRYMDSNDQYPGIRYTSCPLRDTVTFDVPCGHNSGASQQAARACRKPWWDYCRGGGGAAAGAAWCVSK